MMYPELFPESARYCYVRTDSGYADLANFEGLAACLLYTSDAADE